MEGQERYCSVHGFVLQAYECAVCLQATHITNQTAGKPQAELPIPSLLGGSNSNTEVAYQRLLREISNANQKAEMALANIGPTMLSRTALPTTVDPRMLTSPLSVPDSLHGFAIPLPVYQSSQMEDPKSWPIFTEQQQPASFVDPYADHAFLYPEDPWQLENPQAYPDPAEQYPDQLENPYTNPTIPSQQPSQPVPFTQSPENTTNLRVKLPSTSISGGTPGFAALHGPVPAPDVLAADSLQTLISEDIAKPQNVCSRPHLVRKRCKPCAVLHKRCDFLKQHPCSRCVSRGAEEQCFP